MTTTNIKTCPVCAEGALQSDQRMVVHQIQGATYEVPQKYHWCDTCGMEFGLTEDARFNARAFRSIEQKANGKLTGEEIRALRKKVGLTQEMAGKLFGGGPVAFCKYEKDDLTPSEPMDNLLWLIQKFPSLANHLASRNGHEKAVASIPPASAEEVHLAGPAIGSTFKFSVNKTIYTHRSKEAEAQGTLFAEGEASGIKLERTQENWSRSGKLPYLSSVPHAKNQDEPMNDGMYELSKKLVSSRSFWTKSAVGLAS